MDKILRIIVPSPDNSLEQDLALAEYIRRFPTQTDAEFEEEMSKHAVKVKRHP